MRLTTVQVWLAVCCADAAIIVRPAGRPTALLARTAAVGGRCARLGLNAGDVEDEDWVKARIAQENRDFSLREAAAARTRQEAEQRSEQPAQREGNLRPSGLDAVPAESAAVQMMITHRMRYRLAELGYSEADVDRLEPQRARRIIQAAAAGAQAQQQATSAHAQPSEQERTQAQSLLEYEARMSELARATPKTEEEKRAARHQDMLDQIEQADAMDERLKQGQGEWKTDFTDRYRKM